MEGEWPAALRSDLEADVRRVADRLRGLSQAQLGVAAEPYPSRAAGGRAVAQLLALAAQGIEERSAGSEPRWRRVPERSDFAVGDQVAVTGHDLVALLPSSPSDHATVGPPSSFPSDHATLGPPSSFPSDHATLGILVGPEETVWAPGSRRTAVEVVAEAADHLAALRRLL